MTWLTDQLQNAQRGLAGVGRVAEKYPRGMAGAIVFVLSLPLSVQVGGALGFVLCFMFWLLVFATSTRSETT